MGNKNTKTEVKNKKEKLFTKSYSEANINISNTKIKDINKEENKPKQENQINDKKKMLIERMNNKKNNNNNLINENVVNEQNQKIENKENNNIIREEKEKINNDNKEQNLNKSIPTYCILFEEINIFNSILIMMSNISIINDYFQKDTFKILIDNCNKSEAIHLSSILYYLYNYLWNNSDKSSKISEKDLLNKYMNFLKIRFNDLYPEIICNNNNLIKIISLIYSQINMELTNEKNKLSPNNQKLYTQNNNNGKQNNFINEIHIVLNNYVNNYFKPNNNSKISDAFIGFYMIETICNSCYNKIKRIKGSQMFPLNNNKNNYTDYNFDFYYYFHFNIDEINNNIIRNSNIQNNMCCYNNMEIDNLSNSNNYIDLINCFDYIENENKKGQIYAKCERCQLFSYKNQMKSIYSLPNILTIVLTISDNYNFFMLDQIDLNPYINQEEIKVSSENIYYVISILCQIIYNKKYICYCINPNNGLWYSYSDGEIKQVEYMDINAIPLIIIYQFKSTIKFKYNSLKRYDFEKYCLEIKFSNGLNPFKMVFKKDELIKNIIQQIALYAKIESTKIKLLNNGEGTENEQKLSDVIKKSEKVENFTAWIKD